MNRQLLIGLTLLSAIGLSSCSGGGGGGGAPLPPPPPPVVTQNYTFAPGSASATKGTAWDIVGVKTTLSGQFGNAGGNSYDTLRVDVTFVQDISSALPAPGQPLSAGNQLGVKIGLDTDNNPNTGTYSACDNSPTITPLEYYSDGGNNPNRLADGNYSIIDFTGAPIHSGAPDPTSEAETSVAGSTFSQTFFLTSIGVSSEKSVPKIGIVAVAVNGANFSSVDCEPHGSIREVFTAP